VALCAGLWKPASLAENGDQGAAGDDEDRGAREPRSDHFRALEEEHGERHAPEDSVATRGETTVTRAR